jgi:hypothetical protein
MEDNSTLSAAMQQNLQSTNVFEPLSKLHPYGGFHKVTDEGSIAVAVGAAPLSIMAVLM